MSLLYLGPLFTDPNNPKTFRVDEVREELIRDFGLKVQEERNKKILDAINDPVDYLKKANQQREINMAAVAVVYGKVHEKLIKQGIPEEEAQAIAKKMAYRLHKSQEEILNLEYPESFAEKALQAYSQRI